ncbi:hypothetical protein TRFO_05388 [Tritrichomonas foetus]|uniref:Tetraspanin family protein n=1 Tax=Tritrichomonas foetus TaxID=1144522 RepID=A0A1J4K747_9EUKA|nr:hypothetical protein TRFO_05388 [Tritrichomonas foetus]|eukprot:OHT06728.1 hypothetical protein TRFO_05388 [Tritrichomonas foetus]
MPPNTRLGHKIAISVCITCSVALAIFVFYHFASVLEDHRLNGVNKYVDNYLRWSSLFGIIIVILTITFAWFNSRSSRSVLIFLTSLVITDLVVSFLFYFLFRSLIVRGYKSLFTDAGFISRAAEFETLNECCGWSNANISVIPDCSYLITCDTVIRGLMKGKNFYIFVISLSISLGLVLYCLIGHILLIISVDSSYQQLDSLTHV